jgi:hypothetical protein
VVASHASKRVSESAKYVFVLYPDGESIAGRVRGGQIANAFAAYGTGCARARAVNVKFSLPLPIPSNVCTCFHRRFLLDVLV